MKICGACKTKKEFTDFGKRSASIDGLSYKCKDCQREYDRLRANKPHRVKARLEYAKTENGKERGRIAKKKWAEKNPVKRLANVVLGNAVRDGKIFKSKSCEGCNDFCGELHGHHDDYAFPLVVRWLCPGCHTKWHKENGEGLNA